MDSTPNAGRLGREKEFEARLEAFRRDAIDCVQALYAYLTIHHVASKNRKTWHAINSQAGFWNPILRGLQVALIIGLGRVFDTTSQHNIQKLQDAARINVGIFSKFALARRKIRSGALPRTNFRAYFEDVASLKVADVDRIGRLIRPHRRLYVGVYDALRDKIFAHTEIIDTENISEMFSKTNLKKLQRLVAFLYSFHGAYQGAFQNGHRLVLRPTRHSVANILRRPRGRAVNKCAQELICESTAVFLKSVAAANVKRAPRLRGSRVRVVTRTRRT